MDDSRYFQQNKKRLGKDFWGPPAWCVIHILAITLRKGTKKEYEEFLWLLTKLLPCDYCKANLVKKLRELPPEKYLTDNQKAFWYTYIIHDLANQHISSHHPKSTKVSPSFDEVKLSYVDALRYHRDEFIGHAVWTMIHILAATLRSENVVYYKRFLELLTVLLPNQDYRDNLRNFLRNYNIDPYLRSNHDAFFYSYILHKTINEYLSKPSPPYTVIKNFYFSSLGEECDDCKV